MDLFEFCKLNIIDGLGFSDNARGFGRIKISPSVIVP